MSRIPSQFTFKHTQGSLGDFQTEYWTDQDWQQWQAYVEELKQSGQYGKPVEYTIALKPLQAFDGVLLYQPPGSGLMSHQVVFLNLNPNGDGQSYQETGQQGADDVY